MSHGTSKMFNGTHSYIIKNKVQTLVQYFRSFLLCPQLVFHLASLSVSTHTSTWVPPFLSHTSLFLFMQFQNPNSPPTCLPHPPNTHLPLISSSTFTRHISFPFQRPKKLAGPPRYQSLAPSPNEMIVPVNFHGVLLWSLSFVFMFLFPLSYFSTTSWSFLEKMIQQIQLLYTSIKYTFLFYHLWFLKVCLYLLGHVCFLLNLKQCDSPAIIYRG